jgi:hypothetical protein
MKTQTENTIEIPGLSKIHANRETWLLAAVEELDALILDETGAAKAPVRVSCGWPSTGAIKRANAKSRRIGECWHSGASGDGTREIFISPALDHPVEVVGVLLHELIHAYLPEEVGHKAPFARIARAVGLAGKPTATFVEAETDLAETIVEIIRRLGEYPHKVLDRAPRTPEKTRMLKVECPCCGYILRTARKNLEERGFVRCSCGAETTSPEFEPETEEVLTIADATTKFQTSDGRFEILASVRKRKESYTVSDDDAPGKIQIFGTRADALAFIAAIRDGSETWNEEPTEEADFAEFDDPFAEPGSWLEDVTEEDDDHDDFLAVDTKEIEAWHDRVNERRERHGLDPAFFDLDSYEAEKRNRDAVAERTRERIVAAADLD